MIWFIVVKESRGNILKVVFLNVGQGDSIFIEAPNGRQVLVDGGPPKTVLRELGKVMPFYDRTIDMIILTNPDTDHMAGFIDVIDRFKVDYAVESGTLSTTAIYKTLSERMDNEKLKKMRAERGMIIYLDRKHNIYMQILFPDRDVSGLSRNDGSIMMRLVYGDTAYMFTGDAPIKIEEYLIFLGDNLKSDVLKVGHHGSKTSTGELFLEKVKPTLAVIQAGKDNSYGHPHKEVTDLFKKMDINYLVTSDYGRVLTYSNGEEVAVREK